ncbi:MAG TPA: O-methyltransferase [Thermoanaerobaculia bacterium]|nr:O-methyltransferase [Thermoanaerobaculia bacterium]
MKERIDAILKRPQAEYLDSLLPARDPLLRRMEAYAAKHGHPIADPEVAQLMRTLVRAKKPRRIIEVGTNIGYSVIVMARECGPAGVVETIELDRKILAVAKHFVTEAELPCPVLFHNGAALDVIPDLEGTFDFAFIDCVKTEYERYLDQLLPKLEQGAMIVCDNLLWKGQIAKGEKDASTKALRKFNRRITTDARLLSTVVAVGDGVGISIVMA